MLAYHFSFSCMEIHAIHGLYYKGIVNLERRTDWLNFCRPTLAHKCEALHSEVYLLQNHISKSSEIRPHNFQCLGLCAVCISFLRPA